MREEIGTIVRRMPELSGLETAIPCVSTVADAVTVATRERGGSTEWWAS